MLEQIKTIVEAERGQLGDDLADNYAQLVSEHMLSMNNAWYEVQLSLEESDQIPAERLEVLSREVAKVVCAVTAFGYSFGLPIDDAIRVVLGRGEAFDRQFVGIEKDR
jgi:hypothetical protein